MENSKVINNLSTNYTQKKEVIHKNNEKLQVYININTLDKLDIYIQEKHYTKSKAVELILESFFIKREIM